MKTRMKRTTSGSSLVRTLLSLVTGVALLCATLLATPEKRDKEDVNKRSVQGSVLDSANNPLDGAVVQLKDAKTLTIRSFITRANGKYHFNGLSKDVDYELTASFKGKSSSPRTLSSFDGRKQPVMDLTIEK
jgi:hypothetical protein